MKRGDDEDEDLDVDVEGEDQLEWRVAQLEKNSVTKDAFAPVRNLVFGATGLMLTAVLLQMIARYFASVKP